MDEFLKWLSNYSARKTGGNKIDYLLVPEKGRSGAWHIHGLMSGIPRDHLYRFEKGKHLKRLVDNNCLRWKAYAEKFGFCYVEKVRSVEGVAGYITKRIRTPVEMQKRELHSRLYYCSRGLKRSIELCRGFSIIPVDKYGFENDYVGIEWISEQKV
jgi:hypothetical protein